MLGSKAGTWQRNSGLTMEPRRLWRRHLVYGAEFAVLVLLELLGLKRLADGRNS